VIAGVLAAVGLLLAQQAPPRDAASKNDTTGTAVITGRVLAGTTDTGVASAPVRVARQGDISLPRGVLTDREGRYTFDKLPPGVYNLSAMPPEHAGRFILAESSPRIEVGPGETATAPDLRLPFGAAISGRIVDERGEPLANVDVYAMRQWEGDPTMQRVSLPFQRTDDHGRFRLFGLPPVEIIVAAQPATLFVDQSIADVPAGFVLTYYPGVTSQAQARRITLRQAADLDGVDIEMRRTRTFHVRGTLIDSRGLPRAGVTLAVRHTVNGMGTTDSVAADSSGSFDIRGILPGTYRLTVGPPLWAPLETPAPSEYANVSVEVADADVDGLIITTKPTVDLTVRVVFEPEQPARLPEKLTLAGSSATELQTVTRSATINPDSTAIVRRTAGPLVIRANEESREPPRWFLKGVFLGDRDITDTPIEFTAADATRVRVVLTSRGATISGTVRDDGEGVSRRLSVLLFPEDPAAWIHYSSGILIAEVEKNAGYTIRGVRPGRYRIVAVESTRLNGLHPDPASLLQRLLGDATAITVTEDEQRQVDLRVVR